METARKTEEVKSWFNRVKAMVREMSSMKQLPNIREEFRKQMSALSSWNKRMDTMEFTDKPKLKNARSDGPGDKDKQWGKKALPAVRQEQQVRLKEEVLEIQTGVYETEEGRRIRDNIKSQSKHSFASKTDAGLSELEVDSKQIQFLLNQLAPENFPEIMEELGSYLVKTKETCELIVQSILEKSKTEIPYLPTYATLCRVFSNCPVEKFQFCEEHLQPPEPRPKSKKANPFRECLINRVQHTFEVREEAKALPEDDRELYLEILKKEKIANVIFMAELITQKVLSKRIVRNCIVQLMTNFLSLHSKYEQTRDIRYESYYYDFDALIKFLEQLGQAYDSNLEKEKKEAGPKREEENLIAACGLIKGMCHGRVATEEENALLMSLRADDYFELLRVIDQEVLSRKQPRISSLLQNLAERRAKGWAKHNIQMQAPKKIGDAHDAQDGEARTSTAPREKPVDVEKRVEEILRLAQNEDDSWKGVLRPLCKSHPDDFYHFYLKKVAEGKVSQIKLHLEVFKNIQDIQLFNFKAFKASWPKAVRDCASVSSDLKFLSASLAQVLLMIHQKTPLSFSDFFIKFDPEED